MSSIFIVFPIVIIGLLGVTLLIIFAKKSGKNGKSDNPKSKDRNAILKEANKRLAQNPKDAEALLSLADLYYSENNFEKSMKTYGILIDLCATNPELDELDITVKYAMSAMKMKQYEEAYKSFLIARSINQDVFEVNYNLGYLEYKKKSYEKAASLLNKAKEAQPEHVLALKYLGYSLNKIKKYREAASALRKSLDLQPDDKEALFVLGQCYHEIGQNDQAIQIFSHLRTDPEIGPNASLFSGTINLNNRQYDKAIMDFEIGLKHESIKKTTALEMKYRLASAYIKKQDIGAAVKILNEIQDSSPAYKDVPQKLKQYGELHSNQNLQRYLMSTPSEFTSLCRKIAESFFPNARVKVVDLSMQKSEYADILAEVSTPKWEDTILYRFIRTTNQVGELILRDLYGRIKEVKAGRGFCLSAGKFSEGAHQFVEARLIDLVEREQLMKTLKKLNRF